MSYVNVNLSCSFCHATGRTECSKCRGSGRLKWYIQLTVVFKNNTDDYIKKSEQIPDKEIRNCQAQTTFSEQSQRVGIYYCI